MKAQHLPKRTQKLALVVGLIAFAGATGTLMAQEQIEETALLKAAQEYALQYDEEDARVYAFFAALSADQSTGSALAGGLSGMPKYQLLANNEYVKKCSEFLNQYSPFVIGGLEDTNDLFPSAVIAMGSSGNICSGVVVSPIKVLTAAHCVCSGNTRKIRVGYSILDYTKSITVTERHMMVDNCEDDRHGRDLALLTLTEPAGVPSLAIHDFQNFDSRSHAIVVGYGNAEPGAERGVRRYGPVVIASHSCEGTATVDGQVVQVDDLYDCAAGRDIVAGAPDWPTDSCSGDSGGPLLVETNGTYEIVAITARGIPFNGQKDCGAGGAYTRLDGAALDWLAQYNIN